MPLEGDRGDQDEDQDRYDLGDGRDPVDDRGLLHPAKDQVKEQPHPDRRGDDRDDGVAGPERGKRVRRGHDDHPVGRVARAGRGPEAEGRVEADVVAESGLGVGEDAGVQVGLRGWRGAERRRPASTHSGAGDGPGDDRAQHAGLGAEAPREAGTPRTRSWSR